MKTLATLCFSLLFVLPALAGPRMYQTGKILAFDTGQAAGTNKHANKGEVVYQVQIGETVYKVTNYTRKQDFSAGEEVQCRVEKTHLYITKPKGGKVKYDILGESARSTP